MKTSFNIQHSEQERNYQFGGRHACNKQTAEGGGGRLADEVFRAVRSYVIGHWVPKVPI